MTSATITRRSSGAGIAATGANVAILALPHGLARDFAGPLLEAGLRVIDLSADFRIKDAALVAFVFMGITGFASWLGLWQFRRFSHASGWTLSAVLVLSIVSFGLMARAANLGGEISHPEIRSSDQTAAAVDGACSTPRW